MSKKDASTALSGLFGAYASDDEDNSGSGEEEGAAGAGVVLLGTHAQAENAGAGSEAGSDEHPVLSSLLSPSHMHEVASVAQLAPSGASDQALAGASEGGGDAMEMDPAQQRSSGAAGTSQAAAASARLPPELADPPLGQVDPAIQVRMDHLHRAKATSGKLLTAELRRIRDYKNPDFLEKMVKFHGIADAGSSFPLAVFDPAGFPKEDFYDELAKEWDAEAQRRTAQRNREGMQFQRGAPEAGKKLPAGLSSGAGGSQANLIAAKAQAQARAHALASSAGAKRSKWDSAPRR